MTDSELLAGFENCTLPASSFRHEQHLHVAFLYLRQYSVIESLARFSKALIRFAASHGKADLYHETITWAYILLLRERMSAAPSLAWDAFKESNPDLFEWNPSILSRYYNERTLRSDLAKSIFLMPDNLK